MSILALSNFKVSFLFVLLIQNIIPCEMIHLQEVEHFWHLEILVAEYLTWNSRRTSCDWHSVEKRTALSSNPNKK